MFFWFFRTPVFLYPGLLLCMDSSHSKQKEHTGMLCIPVFGTKSADTSLHRAHTVCCDNDTWKLARILEQVARRRRWVRGIASVVPSSLWSVVAESDLLLKPTCKIRFRFQYTHQSQPLCKPVTSCSFFVCCSETYLILQFAPEANCSQTRASADVTLCAGSASCCFLTTRHTM